MKWRNQLLALVCLFVFAALGVLYFKTWVIQKPFAIVLFVGEGLTTQRLAATRVYLGGSDSWLAIDGLEFTARVRNYSEDFAVPDSAAAASAIATGVKVKNGALSVSESGAVLPTILEKAHDAGRATGIITDGSVTNATAAAFFAHTPAAKDQRAVAAAIKGTEALDLILGGGAAELPPSEAPARWRVVRTSTELEKVSAWPRSRVLGIFGTGDLPFSDQLAERSDAPALADMVRRGIELLQTSRRGYLLVVDAHLMATAAWQNAGERALRETAELDRAVQVARDYAGKNTTIIVTGDVAIGGMAINGYPFRYDSGLAILGLNSAGQPSITWASGPNAGTIPAGTGAREFLVAEPALLQAPAALNTVEDPILNATGPGADKAHGTIDNTQIPALIQELL